MPDSSINKSKEGKDITSVLQTRDKDRNPNNGKTQSRVQVRTLKGSEV